MVDSGLMFILLCKGRQIQGFAFSFSFFILLFIFFFLHALNMRKFHLGRFLSAQLRRFKTVKYYFAYISFIWKSVLLQRLAERLNPFRIEPRWFWKITYRCCKSQISQILFKSCSYDVCELQRRYCPFTFHADYEHGEHMIFALCKR